MMKISLIVAMDQNNGIGKDNDLMWHLPRDMKFFKTTTENHIVIMGRKNFDSIPDQYRPLSNRLNVIITRNQKFEATGCMVFYSIEEALDHFKDDKREIFIIGGGEIYKIAMNLACLNKMFITHVKGSFNADTFFPGFNESFWLKEELMRQEVDEKHQCGFQTFLYTKRSDM